MSLHFMRLATAVGVCAAVAGLPAGTVNASGRHLTGGVYVYVVSRGESLIGIAARFGVDVGTLVADNELDSAGALLVGQRLKIDNRHIVPDAIDTATVLINVPQRILFLSGQEEAALPVAVGRRDWATPIGSFTVTTRETDPTWDVPASILEEARRQGRVLPRIVPPGPTNPLGKYWLGLSGGGIGLHGTNQPNSIYRAATHGCVRLHPDDIAWLYPRVGVGARVMTLYEPVLLLALDGRVFLEVHPDVYRRSADPLASARRQAAAMGLDTRIDWVAASRVVADRHGIARDVTTSENAVHDEQRRLQ